MPGGEGAQVDLIALLVDLVLRIDDAEVGQPVRVVLGQALVGIEAVSAFVGEAFEFVKRGDVVEQVALRALDGNAAQVVLDLKAVSTSADEADHRCGLRAEGRRHYTTEAT